MDRLDRIVIDELTCRILQPDRLRALLEAYLKSAASQSDKCRGQLARLRQARKETEAGIARLLTLVEQGVMEVEDPNLRERLVGLKVQRNELAREITDLQKASLAVSRRSPLKR